MDFFANWLVVDGRDAMHRVSTTQQTPQNPAKLITIPCAISCADAMHRVSTTTPNAKNHNHKSSPLFLSRYHFAGFSRIYFRFRFNSFSLRIIRS